MFVIFVFIASFVTAQIGDYSALAVLRPRLGEVLNAGDLFELKWKPSTAIPTVDLMVKTGSQGNLVTSTVIARNLPNTVSYMWDVPRTMKTSTALSLMIHDSRDPSISNFSPYFTVLEIGRGITKTQLAPSTTTIGTGHNDRPTKTIAVHIKEHRSKTSTNVSLSTSKETSSDYSSDDTRSQASLEVAPRNKSKNSLRELKAVSGCACVTAPSVLTLIMLLII